MNTTVQTAETSLHIAGLDVDVEYKNIKNLYVGVHPPAGRVRVSAPLNAETDQVRRAVLGRWYRAQLKQVLPSLIHRWEQLLDVQVTRWSVRQMKTRWGSCNPENVEYIALHEVAHLRERGHGRRFSALMDKAMPSWRTRRDRLNDSPLREERWS